MDPPPESEYWNLVRDFYQSGTFCDLELLTEDGVLKCHQLVLASVSAVLGKCLRRHFRAFPSGSDDNRGSTTVILQDVSSIELRVIVDCIYDRLAGSDGDYLEINPGLSQLLGLCKPDFQKLNFLDRDLLKKVRCDCYAINVSKK